MPRITPPDSWAVNNITNIRPCLDSAECVSALPGHFQAWPAPTLRLAGKCILNRFHPSCSKLPPAADASTGFDLRLGLESDVMHKNTDSVLKLKIRGLGCD